MVGESRFASPAALELKITLLAIDEGSQDLTHRSKGTPKNLTRPSLSERPPRRRKAPPARTLRRARGAQIALGCQAGTGALWHSPHSRLRT